MKRAPLVIALVLWSITSAYAQPMGWDGVEKVLGRKGTAQGETFKITFPRSDLSVKIGEVVVEPGLALTSWIGFKRTAMGNSSMMMGDLALLENEVAPVTAKLVAEGVKITAIHNHLLGSLPVVMYLHFSGEGNPEKLAVTMHSALSVTGTPMTVPSSIETAAKQVDWAKVEAILGKPGQKKGNLLQMSFPRQEQITEKGMIVPPYLGVASAINLQIVGTRTATTGDFVLIGSEVNPVIKALINHGIIVTAVHSHMLFESPRLFFLHFWGYDEPEKLAYGLKAALDQISLAK
jgi:hypothetical protein